MSGAPRLGDLESLLQAAGFEDISIEVKEESREVIAGWMPGTGAEDFVASARVCAVKPKEQATPIVAVCGLPEPSSAKQSKGG